MKRIITNGITDLEPLAGSSEWYWGTDYRPDLGLVVRAPCG